MISFCKPLFSEEVLTNSQFARAIIGSLHGWLVQQKPYAPVLLGIVRQSGIEEVIYGPKACEKMASRDYYCIDYYEYKGVSNDKHSFTHVASKGKSEKNSFTDLQVACYDPLQAISRVRFALEAMKCNKWDLAKVWTQRAVLEPVTHATIELVALLVKKLINPQDPSHRDLPLAKRFIDAMLLVDGDKKMALNFLVEIGELYRLGCEGVNQDLFAAERYFLRAMYRDKSEINARLALGVIYCKGSREFEPRATVGQEILKELLGINRRNVTALNCLGDLSLRGAPGIEVDLTIAELYFRKVLKIDKNNSVARAGLHEIKEYVKAAEKLQPDFELNEEVEGNPIAVLNSLIQEKEHEETGKVLLHLSSSRALLSPMQQALFILADNEVACDLLEGISANGTLDCAMRNSNFLA